MLQNILTEAGFELQYKDLSYEEIDSRTRILIVSNPSKDFTRYEGGGEDSDNSAAGNIIGAEEMAETEKIGIYLGRSNGYNSMIVLVNSSTPKLPTLEEYLLNSWGLGYNAGRQIIDTSHSIGNDGSSVVGKYITKIDEETGKINENTVGYNIHKTASSIGTGSKTVFKNAVELYYNADEADQDVTIETVISTNDTAEIVYTDSEGNEIRNDAGETPLMLVSTVFDYGENNVGLYGYVMLVSSTDFASDTYLVNKYGNNNVLLGAARVMSTERVIPDLEYKTFVDEAMDIELGTATALTWMVSAILPTMIIIIGLVVFFKRRHL
ncbi:MAG TPA: hypothetical protein DD733_01785 [Clostridiales bacterium]|nr:hypothetical protein [Clostridiales bacterium]